MWTYAEYWCDVKVYEVETRADDGTPGAHRRDAPCSPDPVPDIADADTYLEGYVKWDGCAVLNQGCPHWCGPADFVKHCELLRYIYTRANELMERNPPEDGTWEEAIEDHAKRIEPDDPPAPKLLEGGFYVGTNTDPKYPGIISGPFTVPPRLTGPNHTLWRAAEDQFVREENLEFH